MGKNPRIGDPIDRLLQEREQYATWLSRLDATTDTAPESVRGKVRSDYKARLDAVIEQLRSHSDGLAQQLERHRDTRSELSTREAQAKEIMSEAEVRHAVGEYSDTKWQQIRGEAQKNLVSIREELTELGDEIAMLENVQRMLHCRASCRVDEMLRYTREGLILQADDGTPYSYTDQGLNNTENCRTHEKNCSDGCSGGKFRHCRRDSRRRRRGVRHRRLIDRDYPLRR